MLSWEVSVTQWWSSTYVPAGIRTPPSISEQQPGLIGTLWNMSTGRGSIQNHHCYPFPIYHSYRRKAHLAAMAAFYFYYLLHSLCHTTFLSQMGVLTTVLQSGYSYILFLSSLILNFTTRIALRRVSSPLILLKIAWCVGSNPARKEMQELRQKKRKVNSDVLDEWANQ